MSLKVALQLHFVLGSLHILISSESVWHSYKTWTGYGNREEITITDVILNEHFKVDEDIKYWKSVSLKNESYAVGINQQNIFIIKMFINKENNLDFQKRRIDTKVNVSSLDIFKVWNKNTNREDVALLISLNNSTLSSYSLNDIDLSKKLWSWSISNNISYFLISKISDKDSLLIISNDNTKNKVLIYEFDGPLLWLTHVIPLQSFADNLAISEYRQYTFLSILQPHQNTIEVYQLKQNKFLHYQSVSARRVSQILPFKIGFKSFIVTNGDDAAIFQFTNDGLILEQHGMHLNGVGYWLAMPLKTYRDEVVLFNQRVLDHDHHTSIHVEALVFGAETFVRHEEMPCVTYGVTEHGLGCLVDDEAIHGLIGSAVVSVGSVLALLIPGANHSRLFTLRRAMKELQSPIEQEIQKLQETKFKLQQRIDEQKTNAKIIEENFQRNKEDFQTSRVEHNNTQNVEVILQTPLENTNLEGFKKTLEELNKKIAFIKSKLSKTAVSKIEVLDELVIDGPLELIGEGVFDNINVKLLNEQNASYILNDLVRKDNVSFISGTKTFTDFNVYNLTVLNISGKNANNIVYSSPKKSIVISGDLYFQNGIEVLGDTVTSEALVNSYNLSQETVEMNQKFLGELHFETVKIERLPDILESVTVEGNLSIIKINDINMNEIINSICFTNIKNYIPSEIFVTDGILNVTGNLIIDYLNNIKFPEEYILQGPDDFTSSHITGKKYFKNQVTVKALLVDGTINDIYPDSAITLNENQKLPGSYLFSNLEVTVGLGVEGNISGPHLKEFLENPTLTETNNVKAFVLFKSLEVDGAVIISGSFNESEFKPLLKDVVYVDEETITIPSIKTFPLGMSVLNGVHTQSNKINKTPLENLITVNTQQVISLQTWNGDVEIKNLNILGMYDGINVTQLDEETVKLTGEQFVKTALSFENFENNFVDLSAVDFVILERLNDLPVDSFIFTAGESRQVRSDSIKFDVIVVQDVIVDGDVLGSIHEFSIEKFDSRRISATKDQVITAKYVVDFLETINMAANIINSLDYDKLFNIEHYATEISNMLFDGKLKIRNLFVNGSISAQAINNVDLEFLQQSIWTNKNNYFSTTTFMSDVVIKSLTIKNFNSIDFKELNDNIVRKSEKNLTLKGFKIFTNGFHVVKYIIADRLNNVDIDAVLTTSGSQELLGPLHIHGDVNIQNAEINENLNDIPIKYLANTFKFVDNTITVNGDIVFNRLAYIERLWIESFAQERNVTEFLYNIVYSNEDCEVTGLTVFRSPVYVQYDMVIEDTLNYIDFSEFFDDVVLINSLDPTETSVIFNQYVIISEELVVSENMDALQIFGIDLSNWNKATFINQGLIAGTTNFDCVVIHNHILLNHVNDLNMSSIIPLRTDQVIAGTFAFGNIKSFHDIVVNSFVNGYKLKDLHSSTIYMDVPSQIILSPVTFRGNVLVRKNLYIQGLLNSKNISQVITTNTDQIITSNLLFDERVTIDNNIRILTDKINNISLSYWRKQCAYLESVPQEFYHRWVIEQHLIFKGNVEGEGLLGGFNLRKMAADVEGKRIYKSATEKNLVERYTNMCKDVNVLIEKAHDQICLFKYFEHLDLLNLEKEIGATHTFNFQSNAYLLINELASCITTLFVWTGQRYTSQVKISTGTVGKFISVYDKDLLFIVSNDGGGVCEVSGTNIWQFTEENLLLLYTLENAENIHDSMELGTFYGLASNVLTEYRIETLSISIIKRFRKWNLETSSNVQFVPRGFGVGLALYNSNLLMKLLRDDNIDDGTYGYETNECIIDKILTTANTILPFEIADNMAVLNVGGKNKRRSLLAVASHEETSVQGKLDFIKIYEDITKGKLFHKIPAYKPSSLVALELGNNGQTFLLFLENRKTLQVYEYKGIEGFKQRISIHLNGSKLFPVIFPMLHGQQSYRAIGVVNYNEIKILGVEMNGNNMAINKIDCDL